MSFLLYQCTAYMGYKALSTHQTTGPIYGYSRLWISQLMGIPLPVFLLLLWWKFSWQIVRWRRWLDGNIWVCTSPSLERWCLVISPCRMSQLLLMSLGLAAPSSLPEVRSGFLPMGSPPSQVNSWAQGLSKAQMLEILLALWLADFLYQVAAYEDLVPVQSS